MRLARLAVALLACLSIAFPAQADGPGPYKIYLPTIAGCDMTTYATFEISDGDVTIDLLRGNIHLSDWKPAIPQLKGGGIWQDSALATGRRMVDRRFGNVSDSLSLVISSPEQDDTIRQIGDLLHLLEKARDFTASSWQSDPVWLKRQAGCETSPTYALLFDYKIPQLSNPYAAPFAAATQLATMNNFTLSVEHSIWLSCQPGTSECVQASGVQAWSYRAAWQANTAQPASNVMDIIHLNGLPNRMLAADNGEVWRTDTGGTVWTASTVPPAIGVCTMVEDVSGDIYAAGQTGIWRSVDGGDNWAQRSAVRGAAYSTQNQALTIGDDGYLYLADGPNGFYKSTDGGATWSLLFADVGAHAILNTPLGLIAVSTLNGVYRSIDNGVTWGIVYSGQSISMVASPGDGYIYLGTLVTTPTYLFRSSDGVTWSGVIVDSALAVTATRDMILASDGTYYLGLGGGEIYSSKDALSWSLDYTVPANAWTLVEYSPTHAIYAGENGNIYYSVDFDNASMGSAASCSDQVFIANKHNVANLTHIYISDGGVFSPNLFPQTLPGHTHLLPAVPAVNDAVYFGIDSTVANSGPFESLVFDLYDIINYDNSYTITWEYVSAVGAGPGFVLTWSTLTVQDGTNSGSGVFRTSGVSSVHWSPPANWVDTGGGSVNGVTGWWVRARVSALVGTMTSPSQQNRNIYTVVLPYSDIAAAQVGGDIPALAQVKLHNRSDKDGRAGSGPDLWDNRVIIGLRSYDRGPTFTAYLNASDEQNPAGVTVTLGANTTVPAGISGITGKLCTWAAALADTTFTDRVTFTLGPTIARDFYGSFHAFVRANVTSGSSSDIHARLQVRTGSGGVTLTSVDDYLKGTTDYEVLDLGRVSIPASGLLSFDDLGDSTVLAVQLRNDSGAARTVYIHDLILIPVDECAIDATDYANITLSVVGRTSSTPHLLDFDSLTYHKVDVRTLARTADGNGFVTSVYVPGGGPMVLQANARQRLWAFAMQTSATGITYVWLASPWIAHSVQVRANERWLGLRGDR